MKFRPLGDRVLVQRLESEAVIGGILIPEAHREKMNRGRVLAVGSGRTTEDGIFVPLEVGPGDLVLFGKYAGHDIALDGRQVMILREEEIFAVLEETEVGIDLAASEVQA